MEHSILIADDEDSIRFVLTKALQKQGYRIHTARNGAETIDCLRAVPVDVILLDIFLGDTDGLALMKQIQEINEIASIIVITGHGTTQTAIEAAKRRAYDYLTKPFDIKVVIDLVSRAAYATDQAKTVMATVADDTQISSASQPEEKGVTTQIVGKARQCM